MPKKTRLIFSTPMIQALLAGAKTQTRRLRFEGSDEIWVKEVFADAPPVLAAELNHPYIYKTDMALYGNHPSAEHIRWKSPLFMPDKAVRIKIPVKSVRVERLQNITVSDAISEGIETKECADALGNPYEGYRNYSHKASDPPEYMWLFSPILAYRSLWNVLHPQSPNNWESNPSIYAISFENLLHLPPYNNK